jgi:hypothetical protein
MSIGNILITGSLVGPFSGGNAYWQTISQTEPTSLIGYWRLNEKTGIVAADSSGNGHDGTATGVTWGADGIGDGSTSATFDKVNDLVNVYSAGLNTAFDPAQGTVLIWLKVTSAATWSDGQSRVAVWLGMNSSTDYSSIKKRDTNNHIEFRYEADNVLKNYIFDSSGNIGWIMCAMTWSKSADEVKCYINGQQVGATLTGLGAWVGSLSSTSTVIGALNTTPIQVWSGNLAHCALWKTPLSADQIAALYL